MDASIVPKLCRNCAHATASEPPPVLAPHLNVTIGPPPRCLRYSDMVFGLALDCATARVHGPCGREGLGFERREDA